MQKEKGRSGLSVVNYASMALAGASSYIVFSILSSYQSVFYTDVLKITAPSIAIIMLVSKIWDAINDPMMGIIAERTRTPWGRFRPWLLWMAPILPISFVLSFVTWPGGEGQKAVIAGAAYILFGMAYTAAGIPMQSLPTVMTREMNERVSLYSVFGIASQIGGIVAGAIFTPMVMHFGGGEVSSSRGYLVTSIVVAVVVGLMLLGSFLGSKEVVQPAKQSKGMPVMDSFKIMVKDRNILLLLGAMICALVGVFGRIAIVAYYYLYVIERVDLISLFISLNSVGMLVPYFFLPPVFKRFDIKKVMAFSCVLCAAACGALFLFSGSLPIVIVATFILGAGNWLTLGSQTLAAQIIDDNEIRNGVRTEGIIVSTISFSTKLASAIGSAVGVMLISMVGYVPNAAQTAEVKSGMSAVINLIPGAAYLIAIIFFLLIGMNNKKADENTAYLLEHAAANQNND